jgi:hypothetical protein
MSKKVILTSKDSKQNTITATSIHNTISVETPIILAEDSPKRARYAPANNKKPKQPMSGKVAKRIKIYKTLLPLFQKQYPKCFTIPQSPLAIGIGKLLIEKEAANQTEADIKKFLSMYVNTVTYNESIIEGTNRIDLDGKNISIISAEDVGFAQEKILAIKAARSKPKLVRNKIKSQVS